MRYVSNLKRLVYQFLFLMTGVVVVSTNTVLATPMSASDLNDLNANAIWYDAKPVGGGCVASPTSDSAPAGSATTAQGSNVDYAGHPIWNQGQLQAVSQNQSTYQQAAQQVGIPWQMLAVIHLRESGLKVANPSNGQGIYQFADKHGGPYPAGPVSQAEFLRQSVLAAQYLKQVAGGNYPNNKTLTPDSTGDVIKDTFFSYNGRASAYAQQAASLGYSSTIQGFEGSPYVMNKADAKRDPAVSGSTWGQIKTDHGGLSYPANNDYGAFVTYSALAGGASSSGSCLSGGVGAVDCSSATNATANLSQVRKNAVCIAQQELALWKNGTLKPGLAGYGKYSQGRDELWCADFASWVYDQAKYPLQPDPKWNVPAVDGVRAIGEKNGNFHWHPIGGYLPKPGDLVIYKGGGVSHVNMVVGVNGSTISTLGGDQGNLSAPDHTVVSQYDVPGYNSGAQHTVGFVSPD
jgi:hypothetical protein